MNEQDRALMPFVVFVGVVTVGLVAALAFALFPGRPLLAVGATVGVLAPFAAIIAAGLHRNRLRRELLPQPAQGLQEGGAGEVPSEVRVNLDAWSAGWQEQARRRQWVGSSVAAAMALGLGAWLGWAVAWWLGAVHAAMILAVVPLAIRAQRRALRIVAREAHRKFVADTRGMRIPIELLSEPVFSLAAARGEGEVFVAWADIEGWEVHHAQGDAGAQHTLQINPALDGFGLTGRFGFRRVRPLRDVEGALLAVARRHVRCPIAVYTDGVGG